MALPPFVQPRYTDDQWRYIGGFLLYYRAGILAALQSVSDPSAGKIPAWQDPQVRYYQDAESVTRWLLSFGPYEVLKGENYRGETYYLFEPIGP